ncbi:N-formylglutamate amidohydrolase [Candidatus Micrarchaeota archaeon]|nr:N-formylglutamate amidohydrolase [Candidatus Micrarchaeota archaeon]
MIEARLKSYYDPFYRQLQEMIQKTSKPLLVLDGHSMDSKKDRPEVGIVNQKHQSCPKKISRIFKNAFEKEGYQTRYNVPYWGERANILNFARKFKGTSALAIELNKKIYMNEQKLKIHPAKIRRIRKILKQALKKTEKIE